MNKLIKEFNKKDSLIVISSYPGKDGEGAKQNAVACYCKNLLSAYKNRKIIVLAERDGEREMYREGNILVVRCWKPASPLLYFDLINTINNFDKAKSVLMQFEFNMLGSTILTALLPAFFAYLSLVGKKITIMQHQVVDDLASLGGHLNINKGSLKNLVLNIGLRLFYIGIGLFSKSVIVHEEALKSKLAKWVDVKKIFVVSHGLSLAKNAGLRQQYRRKLGFNDKDFVLLMFGYIAWYKGVDWLIKKVAAISKKYPNANIKLLIAGGPSATLKSKAHYRRYLSKVDKLVNKNGKCVKAVGYVPESELQGNFEASDLVVLPYRAMMSASGPLSFALKYNRPYLLSSTLSETLENTDVGSVLGELSMTSEDVVFSLKGEDFDEKILLLREKKTLSNLNRVSEGLRKLRSWDNIVIVYENIIERPSLREKSVEGGAVENAYSYNLLETRKNT